MRIFLTALLIVFSSIALAGCAEIVVKRVDYADGPLVPEMANPRPIKFSRMRFLLPPGTEIGMESGMGFLLGNICSWSNYPVSRRVLSKKQFESQYIKSTFANALEANGYDVVDSINVDFRPEDELQRAEYFISARVTDIDLDVCHRGGNAISAFFGGKPNLKGELYAKIDWSIYDALRRTVVFKTSTEGYTKRAYPNAEGLDLLFYDAFEMAAHNLAADEDFYKLIVEGTKPPQNWRTGSSFGRGLKPEPRKYSPTEEVYIEERALSRQPVPKHIDEIRKANVLIQKNGHGSGFFITREGHILTNQHVVGDATRMRIVTKGKRHKLIAEVLRVDKVRDVALLKLEEIPKNLKITPLPIRTEKLTVSEDVYALGNPISYGGLQDTVTKGIVSAHRIRKSEGVSLPFIQADVDIHGGNSGGALLDEYGNIVGLSVSGISVSNSPFSEGLNFFIPIAEALNALDITLGEQDELNYPTQRDESDEDSADEAYEAPIETD